MDSKSKQDSANVVNSDELELIGYRLWTETHAMDVMIDHYNPPLEALEAVDRYVLVSGKKVITSYDKAFIVIFEPIYKGLNERMVHTHEHAEQALSA